ncbi:MAG TPA: metalloregulator ArsR/SmtB family transcription factor [Aeromicrobium sp.]|nr:metalloregulator ArsR/SmtB family transcription factor [Aeromicrobium sp.]
MSPLDAVPAHVPLNRAKAALFRTLGHPVRIRVLELLRDRPQIVRELLDDVDVEASSLSQQLAVLRREGLVTSHRRGTAVEYRLATPEVEVLLTAARDLLDQLGHR